MCTELQTKQCLDILPFEPHPHVAIIFEFLGYLISNEPEVADSDDDDSYLKSLDPKDWKSHDYYAILGLKKSRFRASTEEVRRAHRRKVLAHHPDKRRVQGKQVQDECHDYFSCITIAYEILGNSTKRHAYDSVDPVAVDDSVPRLPEIKARYFNTLCEFFSRKARWSTKQPVPNLGSVSTPIDDVHSFYLFWENYDTIRDYSFLDEEDKEKGDDRESRRYIERQNRVERARRRSEEIRSIRQVLEMARANDPRLLAEIAALKEAKLAKREARLAQIRARHEAEAEEARVEAKKLAALRAESEEQKRVEAQRTKKEREQMRGELKRERRRLRDVVDKYNNFLNSTDNTQSVDCGITHVHILATTDLLCQRLSNIQLKTMNDNLEAAVSIESAYSAFNDAYKQVQEEIQAPGLQTATKSAKSASSAPTTSSKCSPELIKILVKAVNLLPAGTPKRWEAVAAYVNQHLPGANITGKEALKQAKAISNDDSQLRKDVNAKAYDNFTSSVKESDACKNVTITSQLEAEVRPWSVVEQRALEQALRSCPTGSTDKDRWQCIADIVGTRTRRECMMRCKELSEQVRAKKAAIAATKSSTNSENATNPSASQTSTR